MVGSVRSREVEEEESPPSGRGAGSQVCWEGGGYPYATNEGPTLGPKRLASQSGRRSAARRSKKLAISLTIAGRIGRSDNE